MRTLLVAMVLGTFSCGRVPTDQFSDSTLPIRVVPTPVPPLKLILAVSATQSFNVSDPSGQRGSALVSLLETLPADASVLVIAFAGTTAAFLSPSGLPKFASVSDASPNEVSRLLSFVAPGTGDSTDFVTALGTIRNAIAADLSAEGARYEIILVADGEPSIDQDQALFCQGAVTSLVSLASAANDVKLNTVFIDELQVTPCADPIIESTCSIQPASSRCPASQVASYEARLRRMADLGHGTFKSFRSGMTVDYATVLAH